MRFALEKQARRMYSLLPVVVLLVVLLIQTQIPCCVAFTCRQAGNNFRRLSCHKPHHQDAAAQDPLREIQSEPESSSRRRHMMESLVISSLLSSMIPTSSTAAPATTAASPSPPSYISPADATVTHKVFMNVRIARQDGTFYVRDDLPDLPENRVFTGRLVFGLFGKNSPTHVERFLSYITSSADPLDETPLPNYGRSLFQSLDQQSGLLLGGIIPSLELTDVSGSVAIRYGGRLLPASLWIESNNNEPKISHSAKGLLTHRLLDPTPVFGITTRKDTTELDRSHRVFGRLEETPDSTAFLDIVRDLPVYSVDRPASMIDPLNETPVDDAAQAVFNAQRDFFRKAAKTLGDTRLDKLYDGKLLRRVEVTQVGVL